MHWPRSTGKAASEDASFSPERSEAALRKQSERRREFALLGLVLLGIAIFFIGYATGRHDDTFRTSWYSPLKGTNAAAQTFGTVQGGPIDEGGNTPLLVTVRGLPVLSASEHYVLYVLDAERKPSPCGSFSVGEGTTRVKLSFPGLSEEPHGWRIAREKAGAIDMGKVVARTAWR